MNVSITGRIQKSVTAFILPALFFFLFIIGECLFANDSSGTSVKTGYKYFKNYSYLDYDHHPQNLCILQNEKGLVYAGNLAGLLIYDGVSWELVNIPNMLVRSMALGRDGCLYIGGKDELGYLIPAKTGKLKYISLIRYLEEKHRKFGDVWNTVATKDGVYFRTSRMLFRWNYNKIDISKRGMFLALCLCNGDLWIQEKNKGLGEVNEKTGTITQLKGSEIFKNKKIWMMASYDAPGCQGGLLIGTRTKGFITYNGTIFKPFVTEADDYLRQNRISHGIRLVNGDYAVATLEGGIVILDAGGGLKYIFNKKTGLQNNNCKYVFEDKQGNIWLAISQGITRLESQSPFYHYDARNGLEGLVLCVTHHESDLYAGTDQGVFVLDNAGQRFTPRKNLHTCWDLLSTGETLMAATATGVYQLDQETDTPKKLLGVQTFKLASSNRFPGHTWCASTKGVIVLVLKNQKWWVGYWYKEIKEEVKSVMEDPTGYLWFVTAGGTIVKTDFPNGVAEPVFTRYDHMGRLHEGEIYMAVIDGETFFASRNGLVRFDVRSDSFVPDEILGESFAYGPGSRSVFRLAQDKNRNIWFNSKALNYGAIPGPGNTFTIIDKPFRRIPTIQVNEIYPSADGNTVWFAGVEGITVYNPRIKVKWNRDFPAVIRSVEANDNQLVFGGYKNAINSSKLTAPVLPYESRNIRFRCAAPFFERETDTLYRYKLDGFEDKWSAWTKEHRKYYTNLDGGSYTFHVQARNIYDVLSNEDTFSFKVLPPAYLTWWAFILYVFLLLLLIYLTVKWRSRKLFLEKQKLEQVVAERTMEIRDKNHQLLRQTELLKEQAGKLEAMDRVKSRFFANISHEFRTPLTLIMSPLEQLLNEKPGKRYKTFYDVMMRNAQLLLAFINRLLDLARFDSGKMKLNASYGDLVVFIKNSLASFRMPAIQQQVALAFVCNEAEIMLAFDAEKLEEVLNNLLSNALRFTPSGGEIIVSLTVEAGYVRMTVKDNGIGIPGEQIAHIFDRFYQVDNGGGSGSGGVGIGLSLTREIINLHQGTIEAFSRKGLGTEFVIHLPMLDKHGEDPETGIGKPATKTNAGRSIKTFVTKNGTISVPLDDVPGNTDENLTDLNDDDVTARQSTAEPDEKPLLLVVEDHKDMREHMKTLLEPAYRTIYAVNGKEGIEKAKANIPDLIISDVMMPDTDGYQLCRTLKENKLTCHIPIILLTAKASEESVIRGIELNADDYITKPFNARILCARIENLIDLRRQFQLKIQRESKMLPTEVAVASQNDRFLDELHEIIEKNLADPDFDIEVLSEKLYISRPTLFRKVKALTGETPNNFVRSYRLRRAAQLLKENFGNVTEVAMAVGFSTPQYFSKCFKEHFHRSPKVFRAGEQG